ncbi:MAG: ABC transporter ATP-binding protein [Candidatus Dormibacteria bacterium]
MIRLRDVHKGFTVSDGRRLEILRGINLEVRRGESVAILGRSGSGKTTLLNIIGLLETSDSGVYELGDRAVADLSENELARLRGEHFGFVFQDYHLFPRRSALANVAAPLYHASRREYRDRRETARHLLHAVGLEGRERARPNVLSGGEQQRVAIARSLSRKPKCILADEPTGSLDVDTAERVLDLLFTIVRVQSCALVLITHDRDVARRADRVFTLREGALALTGS